MNFMNNNGGRGGGGNGGGAGYGVLWELDKVDRRIKLVQSEIDVLKQQLKIMRTYYAASSTNQTQCDPSEYCPRYSTVTFLTYEPFNQIEIFFLYSFGLTKNAIEIFFSSYLYGPFYACLCMCLARYRL